MLDELQDSDPNIHEKVRQSLIEGPSGEAAESSGGDSGGDDAGGDDDE